MEVYKAIRADIFRFIIASTIITVAIQVMDAFKDDTDSQDHRSGMQLRTDYGTGCQYLESTSGVLIPRLDSSGNHVCTP